MTTAIDPSDYERPTKPPDWKTAHDQLEAQLLAFCAAAGVEPAELLWNAPKVGQALGVLLRGDLRREAEHLEREAANMRHRASIIEGAAAQLRAVLAYREQQKNPHPTEAL